MWITLYQALGGCTHLRNVPRVKSHAVKRNVKEFEKYSSETLSSWSVRRNGGSVSIGTILSQWSTLISSAHVCCFDLSNECTKKHAPCVKNFFTFITSRVSVLIRPWISLCVNFANYILFSILRIFKVLLYYARGTTSIVGVHTFSFVVNTSDETVSSWLWSPLPSSTVPFLFRFDLINLFTWHRRNMFCLHFICTKAVSTLVRINLNRPSHNVLTERYIKTDDPYRIPVNTETTPLFFELVSFYSKAVLRQACHFS